MVGDERGGVVLRLLLWAVLLVILASAVLFVYVRVQEPLAWGERTVRAVRAGGADTLRLQPGTTVYVAGFLRNEGRMPVKVQGLSGDDEPGSLLVATSLALGDGVTPRPDAAATFEPITIGPGEGVGIFVTYEVNGALDCSAFTKDPGEPWQLRRIALQVSAYAMPFDQTVTATPPLALVEAPTRDRCRAAVDATTT
jgi:hypothetical protein